MAPLRFLLVSTHTENTTGYSKVAYNLIKQLSTLTPVVKVFHYGFQRSPVRTSAPMRPLPAGVVQYDAALNEEPKQEGFGFRQLKDYIDTVNPDVVMMYNDPIVINRFIAGLELKPEVPRPYKLWVYLDMVYKECNPSLIQPIEKFADCTYVFTDTWKQELLAKYNDKPTAAIKVLEHGVDTRVFQRLADGDRMALRKNVNVPSDAIVFLNMNRNSLRKRLDLSIMGFTRLLARQPEKPLYLMFVTGVRQDAATGSYYHLLSIYMHELQRIGLDPVKYSKRLLIVDSAPPKYFDDAQTNVFYNIADIGLNTSNGEGFGLCQLEHMATGAPQVVVNVGGYSAFMDESVAVMLKPSQYSYLAAQAGVGLIEQTVTPEEVADGLEKALGMLTPEIQSKVIELSQSRPWSRVCDPFLEEVISLTNS
jgi:glycosyltransferase involved in cell wall biosynthesis